jgi:hypothetical protein
MNQKVETRLACDAVPGSLGVAQCVSDHDSDDEQRDQAVQRQARVKAGLARRGFTLQQLIDGSFWVTRSGLSVTLDDWHAVERFIVKAGCSA